MGWEKPRQSTILRIKATSVTSAQLNTDKLEPKIKGNGRDENDES